MSICKPVLRRFWCVGTFVSHRCLSNNGRGRSESHNVDAGPRAFFPTKIFDVSLDDHNYPLGIVADVDVDAAGIVYLLDTTGSEVRRISSSGEILPSLRGVDKGQGELFIPALIAVAGDGTCYVTQAFSWKIAKYDTEGRSLFQEEVYDLGDNWNKRMQLRAVSSSSDQLFLVSVGPSGSGGSVEDKAISGTLQLVQGDLVRVLMRTGVRISIRPQLILNLETFELWSAVGTLIGLVNLCVWPPIVITPFNRQAGKYGNGNCQLEGMGGFKSYGRQRRVFRQ